MMNEVLIRKILYAAIESPTEDQWAMQSASKQQWIFTEDSEYFQKFNFNVYFTSYHSIDSCHFPEIMFIV